MKQFSLVKKIMEGVTIKAKRIFRSEAEIKNLLDKQKASEQSIKAFCQTQQIPQASFHNWRRKYGLPSAHKGFATVDIMPSASCSLFAEVQGIKLYQPVSAAYLKELMA